MRTARVQFGSESIRYVDKFANLSPYRIRSNFLRGESALYKNIVFSIFSIRYNVEKTLDNHNLKENFNEIMQLKKYKGLSIISPWLCCQKLEFFENLTRQIRPWSKSQVLDIYVMVLKSSNYGINDF